MLVSEDYPCQGTWHYLWHLPHAEIPQVYQAIATLPHKTRNGFGIKGFNQRIRIPRPHSYARHVVAWPRDSLTIYRSMSTCLCLEAGILVSDLVARLKQGWPRVPSIADLHFTFVHAGTPVDTVAELWWQVKKSERYYYWFGQCVSRGENVAFCYIVRHDLVDVACEWRYVHERAALFVRLARASFQIALANH